jgi:hypothetical protein
MLQLISFFDKINKGTYVLEYDIRVNSKGNFSNGISTMQSMYTLNFLVTPMDLRCKINKEKKPFQFLETVFFISVKCLINHSTFSIIYLSILSTLVVQQTR